MNIMLIECPVANLEAPGLTMAWTTGCLRAAGHNVAQWNAGAALFDFMISSAFLTGAAQAARAAVERLSDKPGLTRIQGAGLLSLLDNLPLSDMIIEHIDAFKSDLRRGGPGAPLSAVPYDPVQAALDMCTAPFFPERIVFPERLRYNNPSYLSPWSPRCSKDLLEAAAGKDLFWDGLFRSLAAPYIKAQNPGLVVLFANGPNQVVPAFKLAAHVRAVLPLARVVLAGNWPGAAMRDISYPGFFNLFHFIVTDAAEDVLPELCRHLGGSLPVTNVAGIRYRDASGAVRATEPCPASRFSTRPAPDFKGYNFDQLFTVAHRLELPFQITTGCTFGQCSFCMTQTPRLGEFACLSPATSGEHLRSIKQAMGCGSFRIADPSLPAKQAARFARSLLDNRTIITWHAAVRPDPAFTYETCELMRAAGCLSLEVGLEALDDKTLARLDKGLTVEQMQTAVRHFAVNGITVNAHMMFGIPGVSSAEFSNSVDRLLEWIKIGLVHNVRWNAFLLLKHSRMAQNPAMYNLKVRNSDRLDVSEMLLYERIGDSGMNEQDLSAAWQEASERVSQALARARARPVRPPRDAFMAQPHDNRFLALKPLVIPCMQIAKPHFSYQELRKCSPIQWNPADISFGEFQNAISLETPVHRLDKPRTLVKNPLANTQFELSDDYVRIIDEVRNGGTVGDIIARIHAQAPAAGEPNEFEDIFRRLVQLRGYVIVFSED